MRVLNLADGYSSNTLPVFSMVEAGGFTQYISDSAYVSANGTPSGGEAYYNSTTGEVRYYDGVEAAWKPVGSQVVAVQELLGTGNGVATSYTITNAPLNDEALHVFLNGVLQQKTDYTISLPNVVFNTAPTQGQQVYVSYLTNGSPASPIVSAGTNNVIYHTFTGGEVVAKQFTLPSEPTEPSKLLVDVVGGTTLKYGVDFTITTDVFGWSGLTLDGVVASGDVFRIQFFN